MTIELQDNIAGLCDEFKFVSFARLSTCLPAHFRDGDRAISWPTKATNIIAWCGVSKNGADAIYNLLFQGFELQPCRLSRYVIDGTVLTLPIAHNMRRYKDVHWVPSVLTLPLGAIRTQHQRGPIMMEEDVPE